MPRAPTPLTRLFPLLGALAGCGGGGPHPSRAPDAAELGPRAWKHLEALVALGPRTPGSPALESARAYFEQELARAGLTPVREPFAARTPVGEFALANVHADLAGRQPANELVILGAHFDTKLGIEGFVGANDGGAGPALLLELARVLRSEPPRGVALRFLFLDGEESTLPEWRGEDNCYGSRHHVAELQRTGRVGRVRAFVLLDMVGDADLGLDDETWSDRRLKELFRTAARRIGDPGLFSARAQAIEDDHVPFLEAGIPSIDLIDFEFGPSNSYWHTPDDVLARCSAASLGRVGALVLAALPALEREFAR